MAYTKAQRAISLLNSLKAIVVDGDPTTDIDNLITTAQSQKDAEDSQAIQDKFTSECMVKLRDCDWTQLDDSGLDGPTKASWDTYRTDLKALAVPTTQAAYDAIVWPTSP